MELEATKDKMGKSYPNKKIIVVPYGHSLPMRVYTNEVIIWVSATGTVSKVDVY